MLTAALSALAAVAVLAALAVLARFAARRCYRIDRDAYHRAQSEWAAERRRAHLSTERSS